MTVHKSTVLNLTRIQPPTTQASSRRLSSKPTISFDRRENQSLAFKKAPVQQNQQETAKIYPDSNRNAATAQNSWKRGAPSQLLSRNGGGGNGNNLNNNKSSSQPDSFKSKKLVSVEKVDPSNNTSNLTFSSSSGLQIQVTKRVSNGQTAAPPRGNVVAPSIPPPPPAAAANQNGDMNQMSTNLKAMLNIGGGGPVATAPPPSLTSSMSPAAAAIPPPQQFQYAGGSGYQQNGYQTQQGWGAPPSHPGGYPHQFYPAPAGYYPPHYYHQQQQQQQPAPVETNVSAQIMQGLVNPYAQMYSPYGGTGAAMPAAMVMPVAPVKNELAQLVENSRPVVNVHDHQNNGYQQQINGHQQQHHHHQNNNRRGGGARGGGAGFKRGGGYGGRGRGGKQQTNE